MSQSPRSLAARVLRSYVTVVVVGVVVGVAIAPVAWNAATAPEGTVAVVPIEGTIDGQSSARVSAMLSAARADPSVKAVVLVSNSGGGAAAPSEELYLQTKRTAEEMPVVASVDATAASGAYYAIAPADRIYVKPSSIVGSIGVLATLPPDVEPNNVIGTTGPKKLVGADRREFFYMLESLRSAFVGAVYDNRRENLSLSRAEISQARIYVGGQAVQNGLADQVGGRTAAVRHAAALAGMDNYRVRELRVTDGTVRFVSKSNYLASNADEKELVGMQYLAGDRSGVPVFLMVPASYVSSDARSTYVAAGDYPVVDADAPRGEPKDTPETRNETRLPPARFTEVTSDAGA